MSNLKFYTGGCRDVQAKSRQITRSMTVATPLIKLITGSRIIGFVLSGVASNATGTAVLSIGSTSANANEFVNAVSVLAGGVGNGVNLLNGVAGAVGQSPVGYVGAGGAWAGDLTIYVKYAETGTASTLGGWWLHVVFTTGEFVR